MELLLAALLYFTTVTVPAPPPLATVELPRVEQIEPDPADKLLVISLGADGNLYLDGSVVTQAHLIDHLSLIAQKDRTGMRVFLRVHPTLEHSRAMEIMTRLKREGFTDIALVQDGNGAALEGSMIPKND